MSKTFKAGDKVRYIGGSFWNFLKGKEGEVFTVAEIIPGFAGGRPYYIRLVEGLTASPTHTQGPDKFELVQEIKVGDLIRVTRKDFPETEYSEGIVHRVTEVSAAGVSVVPPGHGQGLLWRTEVERIEQDDLVGKYVSPIDGRWSNWYPGAYKVIKVERAGVRVKHIDGPRREGVFCWSLFKVVDAPAAPVEFDVTGAQRGRKLKFRSGCEVVFVAYVPSAKPHCQLVLLNPSTGNVVTRYPNGKASTETVPEPGDILFA